MNEWKSMSWRRNKPTSVEHLNFRNFGPNVNAHKHGDSTVGMDIFKMHILSLPMSVNMLLIHYKKRIRDIINEIRFFQNDRDESWLV